MIITVFLDVIRYEILCCYGNLMLSLVNIPLINYSYISNQLMHNKINLAAPKIENKEIIKV